jgi:uncharacterized protein (TIGR02597 family)
MVTNLYKKITLLSAAACGVCGLAFGLAFGQSTAYTAPVGYVSQTCKANSDTVVGLPLRTPAVSAAALTADPVIGPSADPVVAAGSALLTASSATFTAYADTHYVKFNSGVDSGQWFTITENTGNTLTIDLNGATLGAVSTNTFEVIKFWTLNELFNPALCTTDPLTTGNAIVASTNTLANGRRTQVLIPNLVSTGINLAPATSYYVNAGIWKKPGSNTDVGADQLWPDTYFIIRNPVSVTSATTYTISGEVETNEFDISLNTLAVGQRDNFIALPRAIDTKLNDLNLANTSAFLTSVSTLANGRRDQLLVFDNVTAGLNKPPAKSYYFNAGIWKNPGSNTDVGNDVIPAGAGIIIRKYQTGAGVTNNWNNTSAY